jgi:hypothetical protein
MDPFNFGSGSGFGSDFGSFGKSSNAGSSFNLEDPDVLNQLLETLNVKKKPKANFVQRLLALPSALGSIPDVIYDSKKGKNMLDSYLENISEGLSTTLTGNKGQDLKGTSDLLKDFGILKGNDIGSRIARGVVGFAGDVALDPLTYLTFGTSGAVKGLAKEGAEQLGKKGIGSILKGSSDDVAKLFGKQIATNPYLVQALKFGSNPLGTAAGVAFRGVKEIPGIGEGVATLEDTFNKAFRGNKFAESKGLTALEDLAKGTRNKLDTARELSFVKNAPIVNELAGMSDETKQVFDHLVEGTVSPQDALRMINSKVVDPKAQVSIDQLTKLRDQVIGTGEQNLKTLTDRKILNPEDIAKDPGLGYLTRAGFIDGYRPEFIQKEYGEFASQILNDPKVKKEIADKGFVSSKTFSELSSKNPMISIATQGVSDPVKQLEGSAMDRRFATAKEGETAGLVYNKNIADRYLTGVERTEKAQIADNFYQNLLSPEVNKDTVGNKIFFAAEEIESKLTGGTKLPPNLTALSIGNGKKLYTNKDAADIIKRNVPEFFGDEGTRDVLKVVDKFTSFFKKTVTAKGPNFIPYQVRNATDDAFRMVFSGFRNRDNALGKAADVVKFRKIAIEKGLDEARAKFGKEAGNIEDIYNQVLNNNIIGSSQFGDEVGKTADRLKELGKVKTGLAKVNSGLDKVMLDPFQWRENVFRIANFVDNKVKAKDWTEAAKLTRLSAFDYENLTQFEKNVMRRVIPFYSFLRQNLEHKLTQLNKTPGRILAQDKFLNNVQSGISDSELSDEDMAALPDWMKQGPFAVFKKGGKDSQDVNVFTGLGDSLSALNSTFGRNTKETLENLLSSSNPLAKMPIEVATNKNTFTGQEITGRVPGERYRDLPESVKNFLGYKEVQREIKDKKTGKKKKITEITIDGEKAYLMGNIPLVSPTMTFTKRAQDTTRDPSVEMLMNMFSGGKVYSKNLEVEAERRKREQVNELRDLLIAKGVGKESTSFYIPKEQKEELLALLNNKK